jgi:hypothetical protein
MELLNKIMPKQVSIIVTDFTVETVEHISAERGEADGTDNRATNGTRGQPNMGFESENTQGAARESPAVLQVETEEQEEKKTDRKTTVLNPRKESWMDNVIDNSCRENSWFGKKCLKIFKVFKLLRLRYFNS